MEQKLYRVCQDIGPQQQENVKDRHHLNNANETNEKDIISTEFYYPAVFINFILCCNILSMINKEFVKNSSVHTNLFQEIIQFRYQENK